MTFQLFKELFFQKKTAPFWTSLALHSLIILGLAVPGPSPLISSPPVEVQIFEKRLSYEKTQKIGGTGSKTHKSKSPLKIDSLLQNHFSYKPVSREKSTSENSPSDWNKSDSYDGTLLGAYEGVEMQDIRFLRKLWKEIDQSIVNSPYLSEYNQTGQVRFHVQLNSKGQIVESKLRACGNSNVLKVIAARALRKAMRNESGEIPFPKTGAIFSARFSWAGYETCRSLKGINKYSLSFCHYAENKKKDFSTSEKAATYLKALNYGPGAIEEIQKYHQEERRRDSKFNPFRQFERDADWNISC